MLVNFDNQPLSVHVPFHRSSAYERMNFGAFGSGKSYTIIDEAIAWCLEQPGIRGLITRKTIPELRDTTEPVFAERMPPALWQAGTLRRAGGHFESFVFPNGSTVLFRSIDDWRKHKSLNLGFIAWDECNEFDEETYLGMKSRVRQRDLTTEARSYGYTGKITRRGMWGAANPEGHDWLWRRFHPDSPQQQDGAACFTSTTLDNPFLPPDYVQELLQYPKPWVLRYVLCQFDDFAGRIYEEWGWDTHVVELPDWSLWTPDQLRARTFWMGMDPGTENPTAGLWTWLDTENRRLIGMAEYEAANVAAAVHADQWRGIETRHRMNVRWRVADPNAITQRSRETLISLQTAYAKMGYHFSLGASSDKDRIPALGHLIHLRRFVLSKNCPMTFEAIKQYQWKDLTPAQRATGEDPKEQPLKKNTHLVECAQYLAGREAPLPKIKKPLHTDSLQDEIHRAIRKQLAVKARRAKGGRHDFGTAVV